MYFTNITNEELQYFHGLNIPNFSIKLSDILHQTSNVFDNGLFKIDEIIEDKIYKIFPLFYTETITSTNPNDRILENRCIICQKTTDETFITFIRDENETVQDYSDYATYYDVGDTLTTNQFNTIVDLLRRNTIHKDSFSLKQGVINGEYGKYTFNLNSTTIVSNGILITNETLTNLGTVKLENVAISNATYTLKLNVYHITDINACDDLSDNNIVKETLSVELTEDTAVNIPFNTLDYNYIIGFDAEVIITHDKPVISDFRGDIVLTADKSTIEYGETLTLSSQLKTRGGSNYKQSGVTVYFFKEA